MYIQYLYNDKHVWNMPAAFSNSSFRQQRIYMSYAGSRLDEIILSWNLNGTKDVSVSVNGVRLNFEAGR